MKIEVSPLKTSKNVLNSSINFSENISYDFDKKKDTFSVTSKKATSF